MRTASTKLTDEEYEAFNNWCRANNRTINEALGSVVREILQGKVKPRPTGLESRALFCPECGYLAQLIQDDSKFYFWCPKCDWCAYIGRFTLPGKIEDWRKKIKEL